jgi:signal transduction histidine kinase/CheY-like chemotaxis protein
MAEGIEGAGLFFRLFIESSAAFALADGSGAFMMVNEECARIIKSLALPPAKSLEHLLRNIPHFTDFLKKPTMEDTFILPVRDGNNQDRRLRITLWRINEDPSAPPPERGPFLGVSIRDRTGEWIEEQQLKEDVKQAEQNIEAKSLFLANMSHEIRTPIQTIIGMTELLQDTRLDQEQAEYSRQVKFSAEVLLSLINDILDYSKIEAGRMDLEHIPFDLEQAVEQAVEMISLEAHKKGLEIIMDIPPDLGAPVYGDPDKFRQIVINLSKNAVKFTRAGEVIVTVRWTTLAGKEAVRVAVADTGVGVPETVRDKLFTTFYQADPSNTRRFGGTGLGLAISKNLVEIMGGAIGMMPNVGGGSIFHFTVPVERSGNPPRPLPEIPGRRDVRILVVDDREEFRRILVNCLNDLDFTNSGEAAFGEEALTEMRDAARRGKPYELCFLDMNMLPMDGWRLAAAINADPAINSAHLVLMVPNGLLGADAKMTLLRWFSAHINKPVTRRNLAAVIADVLTSPLTDTEAGRGAPLSASTAAEAAAPAVSGAVLPAPAGALPYEAAAGKPLILIVEDNPVNQNLFALIMQRLGYPAILADDGMDALEKTAANPVSIVFMDIQMPKMNGYEAAEELRRRGFTKPVIAVTASALADEWEHCRAAGFDDILIKPFKRPDIERMLLLWEARLEAAESRAPEGSVPETVLRPPEAMSRPPEAMSRLPEAMSRPSEAMSRLPEAPLAAAAATEDTGDTGADLIIFNVRDFLDTFMEDAEMAGSMLSRFVSRTESRLAVDVPQFLAAEDWETGMREAHTIKGTAFQLSGKDLGTAAAALERAFYRKDRVEIAAALPPLGEAFGRFKAAAEQYLAGQSGGATV